MHNSEALTLTHLKSEWLYISVYLCVNVSIYAMTVYCTYGLFYEEVTDGAFVEKVSVVNEWNIFSSCVYENNAHPQNSQSAKIFNPELITPIK